MSSAIFDTVWTLPASMRGVTESRFYLSSSAIDNPSPWTQQRTPYGPFVQVWMADLTFPASPELPLDQGNERVLAGWRERQGFVTRLRGTKGKIRVTDSFRRKPAYDLRVAATLSNFSDGSTFSDGTQWASGPLPPFVTLDEPAVSDADTIVLRGLPESTDDVFSPGDIFEVRPNGIATNYANLYEIVHSAKTNADGKTRVYFQPGLCQGFAAGDMVVLRNATCVMRLADKDQGIVTRSLGNIGRQGLSLIGEPRA